MNLEFSWIASEAAAGTRTIAVRGRKESLVVTATPLFTGGDLAGVRPVTKHSWLIVGGSQSMSEVVLTLKPDAQARIAAASANALGRNLAIILDGEVIGQMRVSSPLDGAELSIAGVFSPAEAKSLARQIGAARP